MAVVSTTALLALAFLLLAIASDSPSSCFTTITSVSAAHSSSTASASSWDADNPLGVSKNLSAYERRFNEAKLARKCSCAMPPVTESLVADFLSDEMEEEVPTDFSVTLEVAMHVIHAADGTGKVPMESIRRQMDVLNEAFRNEKVGMDGSYDAWPVGIQFTLDENKDLMFVNNSDWYFGCNRNDRDNSMKNKLAVDPTKHVNVYLCELSFGALGLSGAWPWEVPASDPRSGVLVNPFTLPGSNNYPYNLGKTLVHEIGHLFGLRHTFGKFHDKCPDNVNDENDDSIVDTTPLFGPTFGGWVSHDDPPLCTQLANVKSPCVKDDDGNVDEYAASLPPYYGRSTAPNFLDYADDPCVREFTPGQVNQIRHMVLTYRTAWCGDGENKDACYVSRSNNASSTQQQDYYDHMVDIKEAMRRIRTSGDAGLNFMDGLVGGNVTREVLEYAYGIMLSMEDIKHAVRVKCSAENLLDDASSAEACRRLDGFRRSTPEDRLEAWFHSYDNKTCADTMMKRLNALGANASASAQYQAFVDEELSPMQEARDLYGKFI